MKPLDYIYLFGVCGTVCTVLVVYFTWLHNRSSSDKSTRIETGVNKANEEVAELRKQNDSLKANSDVQLNKIDELRQENTELYSKLSKASNEIYQNITGGDSYCVFEVFFDAITSKPNFSIRHEGKIPLKNVQVTIEDLARRVYLIDNVAKRDYSSPQISQIINNTYYGFHFPSIYPNTLVNVNIPIESGQKEIRMLIWINLDNGSLFETLEVSGFREDTRKIKLELKRGDDIIYEWKN